MRAVKSIDLIAADHVIAHSVWQGGSEIVSVDI